jgi:hypothetical protein
MIAVLEGCDATGKSTLANKIIDHFSPYSVYHHSTVRLWALRHHMAKLRYVLTDLAASDPYTLHVFDRLWPSECVYGHLYRNSTYDQTAAWMIDWLITELGGVYIWCYDDIDAIVERHAEMEGKRKEHFDNSVIWKAAKAYDDAIHGRQIDEGFGHLCNLSNEGGAMALPNHFAHRFAFDDAPVIEFIEQSRRVAIDRAISRSGIKVNWSNTNHATTENRK